MSILVTIWHCEHCGEVNFSVVQMSARNVYHHWVNGQKHVVTRQEPS